MESYKDFITWTMVVISNWRKPLLRRCICNFLQLDHAALQNYEFLFQAWPQNTYKTCIKTNKFSFVTKQDKCKSPNRTNYNSCFHSLYQTFVILSNIQISNMALCTSLDGSQSCTPRYKSITFIFSMGVLYTNERVPICHKYIHDVLLSFEQ